MKHENGGYTSHNKKTIALVKTIALRAMDNAAFNKESGGAIMVSQDDATVNLIVDKTIELKIKEL